MKRVVLASAMIVALVLPASAQSSADIFTSLEITSNASGTVSYTGDWFREASPDPSLLGASNQVAGGWFYPLAGGGNIVSFESMTDQWTTFGQRSGIIAGNSYEVRFTGGDEKAADYFGGWVRDVPFAVWFLGDTPDDPTDDVRMIPRIVDNQFFGLGDPDGDGVFDYTLDHQASDGDDDPYSDWIYFALPADVTPGQNGYNEFLADGGLDPSTTQLHLGRFVLMNWDRHQNESAEGAGDGPINIDPESGTIFRVVTEDVIAPECVLTDFHVGSDLTFSLVVHEPVSGMASINVTQQTSAMVEVPAFAVGETSPIVITGTITDRANAAVELELTDTKGNVGICNKPRMNEIAIHDAGNMILAMQPNSSFGTFGTSFPTASGVSAFWPKDGGTSHLFAANLWVAADVNGEQRVSATHFGPFEWAQTPGSQITYAKTVSDQDIGMTYDDRIAPAPIGLRVHQQSFQWADPTRDDFVVLKYTFQNSGENGDLTQLFPAIWTDTDIGDYTDLVEFDAERGMVYGYDGAGLGGYVGIKVLGGAAHQHGAYINQHGGEPDSDEARFDLVTNGSGTLPGGEHDMRMIVTAQPFDLPVGGKHTVVFAMMLGADLGELQANADEMEAVYAAHLVDDDADGVPNSVESAVPNPDGSGTGDGNGDTTDDIEQDNVTSLPNGVDGSYLTFESAGGTSLIGVVATTSVPDPDTAPTDSDFPAGFLSLGVDGLDSGDTTTVTIWTNKAVDTYWKYGPTPDTPTDHWYEFLYDGATGAEIFADGRIVLHFVDGKRGDHDLTANGRIQDPGAPIVLSIEAAFASLETQVTRMGLHKKHENALLTNLRQSARKYDEGKIRLASRALNDFIQHVRTFAGLDGNQHPKDRKGDNRYGRGDREVVLTESDAERLEYAAGRILSRIAGTGKSGGSTEAEELPASVALEQNYPNPFNPQTTIQFVLNEEAFVRLAVYDLLGRQVRVLAEEVRPAGMHAVAFDATGLSTGTYFYRLETPTATFTRRMTVTK